MVGKTRTEILDTVEYIEAKLDEKMYLLVKKREDGRIELDYSPVVDETLSEDEQPKSIRYYSDYTLILNALTWAQTSTTTIRIGS